MNVKLLTSSQTLHDMEYNVALAALTCHANNDKEFVPSDVLKRRINENHGSVLEHINLTYSIEGLSRACLQELSRHRLISLSVESTRYTLKKKLQNIENAKQVYDDVCDILPAAMFVNLSDFFSHFNNIGRISSHGEPIVCSLPFFYLALTEYLSRMGKQFELLDGEKGDVIGNISNDDLKYYLPEFWPTNLILTSNIRELRHILNLRTAHNALNEFQILAHSLFDVVPDDFKYLLQDCVHEEVHHG